MENKEIFDRIEGLNEKYKASGQDLLGYLDGLLYMDYLKYWDYAHVDTLLSLQTPRTEFPDESVFIMYHQITELFFKLCLHELKQISNTKDITSHFLIKKVKRLIRYFDGLVTSYEILLDGMEKEQFLKFRMALLPASGFQSAQYRMIEIYCTGLENLIHPTHKNLENLDRKAKSNISELYEHIYWKKGATVLSTGDKTLTLKHFEEKYDNKLIELIHQCVNSNLNSIYNGLPKGEKSNPELISALRALDVNFNINWRLVHYKSAVRYLQGDPNIIAATGGTNWQKYLPPRFQKIIFFPLLWTAKEKDEWGKSMMEISVH